MTKSTLSDLNNHLFVALERVNDDLQSDGESKKDADEIKSDIERANAVANISKTIIDGANMMLKAMEFQYESNNRNLPKIFSDNTPKIDDK